ncbi:hypothetical protein DPMN_073950 [Dreissena polymorpha]|uniref:Uncharacterized protein n=1 Tax=Dreissena polymorpha TaxID=45954 RepID=A0A9D4BK77_DREPO|nr:hypothetical protein DPMN_073950 [Dreissena polymorpha]
MSSALKGRQSILDSLQTDTDRLRASVALCRPGSSRHHDVEDIEKRVSDLRARWDTVKEQVQERYGVLI